MAIKQCPHNDASGWATVEIVAGACEVGEGCDGLKVGCPYAWKSSDKKATRSVNRLFAEYAKHLR